MQDEEGHANYDNDQILNTQNIFGAREGFFDHSSRIDVTKIQRTHSNTFNIKAQNQGTMAWNLVGNDSKKMDIPQVALITGDNSANYRLSQKQD